MPLGHSLEKVLKLNGYNYFWKDSVKIKHVGLIAQDVEKLYPEMFTQDLHGYKMIYYYKIIPVLVEEIKEQQQLINAQNNLLNVIRNLKITI